jgi:hypothetical protein
VFLSGIFHKDKGIKKMNLLEKHTLKLKLTQGPKAIFYLIAITGGVKELVEFFDWMCAGTDFVYPHLLQGEVDTTDEFQGQPIVWDGVFSLDDDGEIVYSGHADASGFGDQVQRMVKVTDQVMAG